MINVEYYRHFNSLPASGKFCHLLITFANSLDPDQARHSAGIPEKLVSKKAAGENKSWKDYPACIELTVDLSRLEDLLLWECMFFSH